jgi:hypothetical protein
VRETTDFTDTTDVKKVMLHRPKPSPAAIRAHERRARVKAGVRWELRVKAAPTRRLVAAMRLSNPAVGDLDTRETLEAELENVVAAFIELMLGPPRRK